MLLSLSKTQIAAGGGKVKFPSDEGRDYRSSMAIDYAMIGRRLQALRKKQKLTQRAIGERLGMTDSNVSLIESGRIKSPPDRLDAYAREVGARVVVDLVVESSELDQLAMRIKRMLPYLSSDLIRTLSAWVAMWESEYLPDSDVGSGHSEGGAA